MAQPHVVDVRDMLCAQALAIVAKAAAPLAAGQAIEVLTNTEDVRHDLLAWAAQRGLQIASTPNTVRLTRR